MTTPRARTNLLHDLSPEMCLDLDGLGMMECVCFQQIPKHFQSGSGQREKRNCPEGEVGHSCHCRPKQAAPIPAVDGRAEQ